MPQNGSGVQEIKDLTGCPHTRCHAGQHTAADRSGTHQKQPLNAGRTVVKAARAELARGLFQTEIGALKAVDPIFTGEGRGELHILQVIAETGEIPFRRSYELHTQTILQMVVSLATLSATGTGPGQKGGYSRTR